MKYVDYDLDITSEAIKLDKALKIPEDFQWQTGDHFELRAEDDSVILVRVDPLIAFVNGHHINGDYLDKD